MVQAQQQNQAQENLTYIFCYGSNGPRQLSERVGTDLESLMARTVPAEAKGWKRGFCGNSVFWENKSPATLFQTGVESDFVEGTAVAMTEDEIDNLDPYEGYPYLYNRFDMQLVA